MKYLHIPSGDEWDNCRILLAVNEKLKAFCDRMPELESVLKNRKEVSCPGIVTRTPVCTIPCDYMAVPTVLLPDEGNELRVMELELKEEDVIRGAETPSAEILIDGEGLEFVIPDPVDTNRGYWGDVAFEELYEQMAMIECEKEGKAA